MNIISGDLSHLKKFKFTCLGQGHAQVTQINQNVSGIERGKDNPNGYWNITGKHKF